MIGKLNKTKTQRDNKLYDKFYKKVFSYNQVAKDLIKNTLSLEKLDKIDIESTEITNPNFVNIQNNERFSDLIYKTNIKGSHAHVIYLCEHQSSNDDAIAIRFLEYSSLKMKEYINQQKSKEKTKTSKKYTSIPIIINILVYHGKKKYKGPKNISEIQKEINELTNFKFQEEIIFKNINIIDLNSIKLEELLNYGIASAGLMMLKIGILKNPINILKKNKEILRKALMKDIPYMSEVINFIFDINTSVLKEKIVTLIEEITYNKVSVMTTAQRFKQEGVKEEVKEEGMRIALNMIKSNLDPSLIHKYTNLQEEQIKSLYMKYGKN